MHMKGQGLARATPPIPQAGLKCPAGARAGRMPSGHAARGGSDLRDILGERSLSARSQQQAALRTAASPLE